MPLTLTAHSPAACTRVSVSRCAHCRVLGYKERAHKRACDPPYTIGPYEQSMRRSRCQYADAHATGSQILEHQTNTGLEKSTHHRSPGPTHSSCSMQPTTPSRTPNCRCQSSLIQELKSTKGFIHASCSPTHPLVGAHWCSGGDPEIVDARHIEPQEGGQRDQVAAAKLEVGKGGGRATWGAPPRKPHPGAWNTLH